MKHAAGRHVSDAACRTGTNTDCAIAVPDLYAEMFGLVRQIPPGKVVTYGQIAVALGDVSAARWVAACLSDPRCPADVPAHRVVLKDGSVGSFSSAAAKNKMRQLRTEGIEVTKSGVDLEQHRFTALESTAPLAALQQTQQALLDRLSLDPPPSFPDFVGGVDVSYGPEAELGQDDGVAAFARVELKTGRLDWSTTLRGTIRFPYLPGFLAFREIPLLLELIAQVRAAGWLTDVVLVDGNGILHHRHAGIATHLGIIAGLRTIGVGKSLLCGKVDLKGQQIGELRPVILDGRTVATAIRTGRSLKPIYISPGQGVNVPFAAETAVRALHGHRVPEPIYLAHHLSRNAVGKN
jgi:deoxyribonuclease V